jgi:predicted kinase
MPNSTLYILCGLPFSGKTTLARALASRCGFVHLDLDAIARAKNLFPEEGINDEQWGQVFREVHLQAADVLTAGKSVVFDAVNYDRIGRDRLRAIAQQTGSSVHVIHINLPIQDLEQRRQANRAIHQRPPVRDEDFMELVTEFEVPTVEENILVYDGTQTIAEWIKNHIRCGDQTG